MLFVSTRIHNLFIILCFSAPTSQVMYTTLGYITDVGATKHGLITKGILVTSPCFVVPTFRVMHVQYYSVCKFSLA